MNIQTVMDAFKASLDRIDGVEVYAGVPAQPNLPALIVYPERIPTAVTDEATFIVWCVAGTVEMRGAWDRLAAWTDDIGPDSIIAAITADFTLGGTVSTVLPLEVRNFGIVDLADGRQVIQAQHTFSVWR